MFAYIKKIIVFTYPTTFKWCLLFCLGYYEHVQTLAEITDKVLNYIKVMARPMIMYQNDHPIQWTPVYAGGKVRNRINVYKYSFKS